uniref:Coatomer WD associated region domain-containing protein n=1 Tax=Panagrolaimus sp. JU765 TaxID=591449 RepID=A0AC34QDL0_9BILA
MLEYQTAVMRHDFESANLLLNRIPRDQRTRVAHFLEKQGFKKQALAVTQDPEHKFDLAINLGELKIAYELALTAQSDEKWNQLGQSANLKNQIELAAECMGRARDYGGLLVLASSTGDSKLMKTLAEDYSGTHDNVTFMSRLLLGDIDGCLNVLIESDRLPEAAFFAHTYCPSKVPSIVSRWRSKASESLTGVGQRN